MTDPEMTSAEQRILDLIDAAPKTWPGAPLRWIRLAEQPALSRLVERGVVEVVEGGHPYDPTKHGNYVKRRRPCMR